MRRGQDGPMTFGEESSGVGTSLKFRRGPAQLARWKLPEIVLASAESIFLPRSQRPSDRRCIAPARFEEFGGGLDLSIS
jgi:hypothetical protein